MKTECLIFIVNHVLLELNELSNYQRKRRNLFLSFWVQYAFSNIKSENTISFSELYREFGLFQRLTEIDKEFPGANVILHKTGKLPKVSVPRLGRYITKLSNKLNTHIVAYVYLHAQHTEEWHLALDICLSLPAMPYIVSLIPIPKSRIWTPLKLRNIFSLGHECRLS